MPGTLRHKSKASVHPVELAWRLVAEAEDWLTAEERRNAYVMLGAGDTVAAIRGLIAVIAREQVALSADVVAVQEDGEKRTGQSVANAFATHLCSCRSMSVHYARMRCKRA